MDPSLAQTKSFLLGVGAQKAGTSWLYQQLQKRHDVDFGFLKEYHIHDAMHIPRLACFRTRGSRWSNPSNWIRWRTHRRQRFIRKIDRYYDYFQWLLKRSWPHKQIKLTGDITPSYSALSHEVFVTVKQEFAKRNITVLPVFIMRDPIERIISSQRMKLRKQNIRSRDVEIKALRMLAKKRPERVQIRSDYAHTLQSLNQSFGLEKCHIGIFEALFQKESYAQLCNYLGIPYQEPAWNERVNASATNTLIPDDILLELGTWQRPAYEAACQALPSKNFAELWPTASRWCI